LTVVLTPLRVLLTLSTVLLTVPPTLSTVLFTVSLAPPVPGRLMSGALTVEESDPPPELPEPSVPTTVPVPVLLPVALPPAPTVRGSPPGFEPREEPDLPAIATTIRFSLLRSDRAEGSVWAEAEIVSGPLVSAAKPLAMPERLVPNPIRAATATGTTHRATPANPHDVIRRCHQASNPLLIRTFLEALYPERGWFRPKLAADRVESERLGVPNKRPPFLLE
jgi:hypothetical protein